MYFHEICLSPEEEEERKRQLRPKIFSFPHKISGETKCYQISPIYTHEIPFGVGIQIGIGKYLQSRTPQAQFLLNQTLDLFLKSINH